MDKRKVTCFLLLVVIGLACICAMLYMLFYAAPHGDQEIKPGTGRAAITIMQGLPGRASSSLAVRS